MPVSTSDSAYERSNADSDTGSASASSASGAREGPHDSDREVRRSGTPHTEHLKSFRASSAVSLASSRELSGGHPRCVKGWVLYDEVNYKEVELSQEEILSEIIRITNEMKILQSVKAIAARAKELVALAFFL